MRPSLSDLDPGRDCPAVVRMIVEIPKGSTNKYEYDIELGVFRLDRTLYSPVHYPGDYGFVPGTLSSDGDPLDVLALAEEPSFPGCLKVLAVPNRDPRYDQIHTLDQIFPHIRRENEHFFNIYKELEGRATTTLGWADRDEAHRVILDYRNSYSKRKS